MRVDGYHVEGELDFCPTARLCIIKPKEKMRRSAIRRAEYYDQDRRPRQHVVKDHVRHTVFATLK